MIIKTIIYLFILFSCGFNFLVRSQHNLMHDLYRKIVYDRISQGQEGYPVFIEIMESLRWLTLLFGLTVLALVIALFFEKQFNKTEKILMLSFSALALLPHFVIM